MAFIPSNMLRWSPWNLPGPTLYGYETTDSTATVVVNNYFQIDGIDPSYVDFSVNDQINCSCSDGTLILRVTSINPVVTQASFTGVGPNSVNTAAIQDGAVTPIKTTGLAYDDLSNLAAVAINAPLLPDADDAHGLGMDGLRWSELYASELQTGHTNGDTLTINAWDVDGAAEVPILTITSANVPTAILSGIVTTTTQAPLTSDTTIATTEYVDDAVAAIGGGGANTALSNLAAVGINTSLVSDTDVTDDLGSITKRWNNVYAANLTTDHTAGHTLIVGAWDVDGGSLTPFVTLTANNTPTCALSGSVTGVTQAPGDNSTKLATTAYADAVGGGVPTTRTITVAGTANEITSSAGAQDLSVNRTWTLSLPSALTFTGKTITGGAYASASATSFTFTTGTIGTAVTGVTQSALTNNTSMATTAYVDSAVAAGGGGGVNLGKIYPITFGGFSN